MGIKQKTIKTIKVLTNKNISGTRIEQLRQALLHFICSKFFLSVVFLKPNCDQMMSYTKYRKYIIENKFHIEVELYA